MSVVKANNIQIGQSGTAANNFVVSVPVTPDGTMKIARGNVGATTQDILTVDAAGNVVGQGLQPALISGTSIKSINNTTLLGSGDLSIQSGATIYAYDSRATLRGLSPAGGDQAIVTGIGLFVWESGSTELDDDETCFATGSGRWLLEAVAWDFVDAQMPDIPNIYTGVAANAISTVATVAKVSVVCTVIGAAPGMAVVVSPPGALPAHISIHGYSSEPNVVIITVSNSSAATSAALPPGNWCVAAFETN